MATFTPVALVKLLNLRVRPLRCGREYGNTLRYAIHELLTAEQKAVLVRKLTKHIMHNCFSDTFVAMLLLACFEPTGKPRKESKLLYTWLLHSIYSSNLTAMMDDWLLISADLRSSTKATP